MLKFSPCVSGGTNPGQVSTCKCTPISRKKITTKQYTPHPYLRRDHHVLATRMLRENHLPSGGNRSPVGKDTVKRRRSNNDWENRDNGKRLGSRIALRLKFPAYYPPGWAPLQGLCRLELDNRTSAASDIRKRAQHKNRLVSSVLPTKDYQPSTTNCKDWQPMQVQTSVGGHRPLWIWKGDCIPVPNRIVHCIS